MMLPHIPHHLGNPALQALYLLREGLPLSVKLFVLEPAIGMTLEGMIEAIMEAEILAQLMQAAAPQDDHAIPADDVGLEEPMVQGDPFLPENPIPAVPLQEIPPQEEEAVADNEDMDPADFPMDPEGDPEDPPVIIIDSDD
ncbi:hypothetical protein TIFTF001_039217 [Ficus carica]|uniref:Uncharacterized protein n=1 Tax=Ficus carica TaxID=3494 RepID=A0AA88JDX3_FICCA|nr:hypothetical protein TIFTF001_039217 [Ficus carica]